MTKKNRTKIVEMLRKAYRMEMETVANYLANSVHLDGIRAKHVRDALAEEVEDELGHAKQLAERIKVLEGRIPGSLDFEYDQKGLQPPENPLDVKQVIEGVIAAEEEAIEHYQKLIEASGEIDPVTEDLAIALKGDEEGHRRLFAGFLAEFERDAVPELV